MGAPSACPRQGAPSIAPKGETGSYNGGTTVVYQIVEMEDTVRIPPNELGEDQDAVARELVHRSFEGRLNKKHGFTLLATDIQRIGEGRVIHGDGAVYQRVKFNALAFKPEVGEVVEGTVCEVVEFGAFVRFG